MIRVLAFVPYPIRAPRPASATGSSTSLREDSGDLPPFLTERPI
jgi:hypothetical protein